MSWASEELSYPLVAYILTIKKSLKYVYSYPLVTYFVTIKKSLKGVSRRRYEKKAIKK